MPLFFLLVGVLLIASAINNKTKELGDLVKGDFTGSTAQPSFVMWILAIIIIGAIGYVDEAKPVSNAFLILVIVVMLLANNGFFAKFMQAIQSA